MTSKFLVGGLAASVLLVAGSTATAQTSAAPAAKPAASKQTNIDQEIKLMRKDVRAEKSKIMLNALELNADQTQKFLPIYKSFAGELTKLNDLREANVREFAANYNNMSDTKADELVNQGISYYKKRTDLIANYYDKVRAALGTGTAARFVQVEAMLDNLIDLQLQSNMPLIRTPTSG
jgi:outer membrane murein-binding lipoprotein Lpp